MVTLKSSLVTSYISREITTLLVFLQGNVFKEISTIIFPKWHDYINFALKLLTMQRIIFYDKIFVSEITECADCVQLNKI